MFWIQKNKLVPNNEFSSTLRLYFTDRSCQDIIHLVKTPSVPASTNFMCELTSLYCPTFKKHMRYDKFRLSSLEVQIELVKTRKRRQNLAWDQKVHMAECGWQSCISMIEKVTQAKVQYWKMHKFSTNECIATEKVLLERCFLSQYHFFSWKPRSSVKHWVYLFHSSGFDGVYFAPGIVVFGSVVFRPPFLDLLKR